MDELNHYFLISKIISADCTILVTAIILFMLKMLDGSYLN